MAPNALPDAAIVAGVLGGLQLAKSLIPQMARWPNNAVRALGFAGCYAMVIVNTLVTQPLTWQGVWGLLPLAGALSGSATLLYHLATDSAPRGTSAPPDSPDRRVLAVPAEAQVSVLVPARPVRERDVAPPPAGAVPAPPSPATPATGAGTDSASPAP